MHGQGARGEGAQVTEQIQPLAWTGRWRTGTFTSQTLRIESHAHFIQVLALIRNEELQHRAPGLFPVLDFCV